MTYEEIMQELSEFPKHRLVDVWNDYQQENNYNRTIYYGIESVVDFYPDKLAFGKALLKGNVRSWYDSYVWLKNDYIFTSSLLDETPLDMGELADWIERNDLADRYFDVY